MKSAKEKYDICETVMRILDGSVDPAVFRAFEKQLVDDAESRAMYLALLEACGHLQKPGDSFKINTMGSDDDGFLHERLWKSLARMEKEAPAVEIEKPVPAPVPIHKIKSQQPIRPLRKTTLIPLVLSAAAVLLVVLFVRFAPVRDRYYGQIVDTHQAVFAGSSAHLQATEYLGDEMLKLEKGLVRIQMDDGSLVLLEAPVELRLEGNDQVFLIQGKLTADVPKSGLGFTVRTPSASIVDYGTEFGVSIDQYATTEAHVLRGNVEMRMGSNLRVFEKAIRLSAHQAGCVSGQTLTAIPAQVGRFTYAMPSAFEECAGSLRPLLYFRLKENDIQTFGEMTGKNGLDIRLEPTTQTTGGPLLGGAHTGYAMQMDGARPLQIRNVWPVFARESGDYTAACWVRFDRLGHQVVWSNRTVDNAGESSDAYYRVLYLNDRGRLEHTAYFPQAAPEARKTNTVVSSQTLVPDQWYFVAVTHAEGGYKLLYIDGQLSAASSLQQVTPLEKYSELTFGQAVDELAGGFTGAIADILFFSRELSDNENKRLYESTLNLKK